MLIQIRKNESKWFFYLIYRAETRRCNCAENSKQRLNTYWWYALSSCYLGMISLSSGAGINTWDFFLNSLLWLRLSVSCSNSEKLSIEDIISCFFDSHNQGIYIQAFDLLIYRSCFLKLNKRSRCLRAPNRIFCVINCWNFKVWLVSVTEYRILKVREYLESNWLWASLVARPSR